jgi:hypothetical protein
MTTTTLMTWVRTRRRAPGEDTEAPFPRRVLGPWHAEHEHGQTWCGRRPGRLVGSERQQQPLTYPPTAPEGQVCAECRTALAGDRPRSYRRR